MAAQRKLSALASLNPDLAILCECASPDVAAAQPLYSSATSYAWVGTNPHKGLAILGFGDVTIEKATEFVTTAQLALPVRVRGPLRLNLLGIWTKGRNLRNYTSSVERALVDHAAFLTETPAIVAGDFNSNQCWDDQTGKGHSKILKSMEGLAMRSAYHTLRREPQGLEKEKTMFLYRDPSKGFHIDHMFVPSIWQSDWLKLVVGDPSIWLQQSDHMPLTLRIDLSQMRPSTGTQ